MAQKEKSDIVYALADYKQLVIAYKTKYAHMVQQVAFWKTCVIWLGLVVFLIGAAADGKRTRRGQGGDKSSGQRAQLSKVHGDKSGGRGWTCPADIGGHVRWTFCAQGIPL